MKQSWLLLLILAAGCSSIPTRNAMEVVEAEGWAPVDPQDPMGTRQRALAEAQRRAIEKATGVFLAASTRVDSAIAVRQKIVADARGRIDHYEVLDERTEAGFLKTRVRAFVVRRQTGQNEQGVDVPAEPPPESPRLLVAISGTGHLSEEWSACAVSAIRSKLAARGFSIIEAGSKPDARHLVIRGDVRAYPINDPRLGSFLSFRARINTEISDPTTGMIWKQSQEASSLGVDPESASSQAIEKAGILMATAVANDLTAYLWKHP